MVDAIEVLKRVLNEVVAKRPKVVNVTSWFQPPAACSEFEGSPHRPESLGGPLEVPSEAYRRTECEGFSTKFALAGTA